MYALSRGERIKKKDSPSEPSYLLNERCLRYPDVRLIGSDGRQIGIVQTRQALRMAQEAGLDLVMVAPQATPPVCRIINFGKYRYELDKKERESKAKRAKQELKGIQFRPGTASGDLEILLKKTIQFLEEGNKVRFTVRHRARELSHPEIAKAKLEWFLEKLGQLAIVEKPPTLDGNQMTMVISPNRKFIGVTKDAETKDKQNSSQAV